MDLKPIKTDEQYNEYLKYLDSVFHLELSQEESDKVEIMEILIENYESRKNISEQPIIKPTDELNYIYSLVEEAIKLERGVTIEQKCLKIGEEFGELCAEILKSVGYKQTNDTKEKIYDNTLLEGVDCLITILNILIELGYNKKQMANVAEQQINKWLTQINNK